MKKIKNKKIQEDINIKKWKKVCRNLNNIIKIEKKIIMNKLIKEIIT